MNNKTSGKRITSYAPDSWRRLPYSSHVTFSRGCKTHAAHCTRRAARCVAGRFHTVYQKRYLCKNDESFRKKNPSTILSVRLVKTLFSFIRSTYYYYRTRFVLSTLPTYVDYQYRYEILNDILLSINKTKRLS